MPLYSLCTIFFFLFSSYIFAGSELSHVNQFIAQSHNSKTSVLLIRLNTSNTNNNIEDLDHLMEHMLFKGTKEHTKYNDFMSFLNKMDISNNAKTHTEYIDFYYKINNDILESAIDRILSQFNEPLFSPEQIKRELVPFKEELLKNKLNAYPKLNQCLFNQSKKLKFNSKIELLDENQLSRNIKNLYQQFFKPENFTFFLWSSHKKDKLEKTLSRALNNLSFPVNTFKNVVIKEKSAPSVFAFCEEANSPKNNLFHLKFDLKDFFVEEDIHLFFSLILSKKAPGSFLHQLRKNTQFSHVSFIPTGTSLTFSFGTEIDYGIEDVMKAKLMLYEYLNLIIDQRFTNEINSAAIANYLYPLERTYHYSEIIKKLNQVSKKPFEGESLNVRLANFVSYLLIQNQDWAISINLKGQLNNSKEVKSYEKYVTPYLVTDFKDEKINPFLPSPRLSPFPVPRSLNSDFKTLTYITPAYSVQFNETNLISLVLQIETANFTGSNINFSQIKKHFMEQNKEILNTLANAYVDFAIDSNNSLNLRITSYHGNFPVVLKEIMGRLQKSLFLYSEDYSARMFLTGNVNESTTLNVSEIVYDYLKVSVNDNSKMGGSNNIKKTSCGVNCIAFPIGYIDKKEAHAFGTILQRLSSNRFFQEIRFNKAVSYDANVVLYYKDNNPEIRIMVSNSKVDMTDYINNYFININRTIIENQKSEFNKIKQESIDKLDNKTSFVALVMHYWKGLTERSLISQGLSAEKEQIRKMSFDRFIEILNKITKSKK